MCGQKFYYCDLVCRNVKIGKGLVVKMVDFGMVSDVFVDGSILDNRDKYFIY